MWGAITSAVVSVISADAASKQSRPINRLPMLPYNQSSPKVGASAKCPCCGSRQFQVHRSRRICTYCRSEQDGGAVQMDRSPEVVEAYRNILYGHGILRPEQVVRIASVE